MLPNFWHTQHLTITRKGSSQTFSPKPRSSNQSQVAK